ncbi:hypothetical protein B566_EDAN012151 [Ephemera danica]|nr:hypothetical protein B566_EDAN012151 [Ephemera danica]
MEEAEEIESRNKDVAKKKEDNDSPRVPSKASSLSIPIVNDKLLEPDLNLKIPVTAASRVVLEEQSRVSMQTTFGVTESRITSASDTQFKLNDPVTTMLSSQTKISEAKETSNTSDKIGNSKVNWEDFLVAEQAKNVQEMERSPSPQKSERKSPDQSSAHQIRLLEAEVQQQEQLIVATQKENEKLCQQLKELKGLDSLLCQHVHVVVVCRFFLRVTPRHEPHLRVRVQREVHFDLAAVRHQEVDDGTCLWL